MSTFKSANKARHANPAQRLAFDMFWKSESSACAPPALSGRVGALIRRSAALRAMRWLPFICLLVCCTSCGHTRNNLAILPISKGKDEVVTLAHVDFDRVIYVFQTTRGALRQTPRWKSDAEFPPLSPRRAEKAALHRAEQLRPDVHKWERLSICLQESSNDAWYYLVTLFRGDIAITGLPYYLQVPVLMDGQALQATSYPRAN